MAALSASAEATADKQNSNGRRAWERPPYRNDDGWRGALRLCSG